MTSKLTTTIMVLMNIDSHRRFLNGCVSKSFDSNVNDSSTHIKCDAMKLRVISTFSRV